MYFDLLLKIGGLSLLGGLLTTVYFYIRHRKGFPQEQMKVFIVYFGAAILVAISAYIVGTAIGIYFACSSPTSGNLCGVYGALGVGPLLSGLALFLYGLAWRSQRHASASVGAPVRTTAGWHAWTEHPLVRLTAGLAGAGLTLYGAIVVLDGEGRGAAAAVVIGIAGVYWGLAGRLPSWFRH